jgi:hypothetical protein
MAPWRKLEPTQINTLLSTRMVITATTIILLHFFYLKVSFHIKVLEFNYTKQIVFSVLISHIFFFIYLGARAIVDTKTATW